MRTAATTTEANGYRGPGSRGTPSWPDLATLLGHATASAAAAAHGWLGRGDGEAAGAAAVGAIRRALETMPVDAVVVTGEGAVDAASGLRDGEQLGWGGLPIDLAVDPIDGTALVAAGRGGACCALAATPRGGMLAALPVPYSERVVAAVGAALPALDAPLTHLLDALARSRRCSVAELRLAVLDRPRHQGLIGELRTHGARVRLLAADIAPAVHAMLPGSSLDAVVGVGGAAEGAIIAAAARCQRAAMRWRPWADDQPSRQALALAGFSGRTLPGSLLVSGFPVSVAVSAVTSCGRLPGVVANGSQAVVSTLLLSSMPPCYQVVQVTTRITG